MTLHTLPSPVARLKLWRCMFLNTGRIKFAHFICIIFTFLQKMFQVTFRCYLYEPTFFFGRKGRWCRRDSEGRDKCSSNSITRISTFLQNHRQVQAACFFMLWLNVCSGSVVYLKHHEKTQLVQTSYLQLSHHPLHLQVQHQLINMSWVPDVAHFPHV